jgi:hypothetical protein
LEIHAGDGAVVAHVNRAGLLCGMGDTVYVRRGVEAGLTLAPSDPHLLRLGGRPMGRLLDRLLAEDNDIPAVKAALSAAVVADSRPAEAGASRDASADQDGDLDAPVQFFDVHADVAAVADHPGEGRRPAGGPGRGRSAPRSNARDAGGRQHARNRRVTSSGRR